MDWGISQEGCFDRVIIVQGASRLPGQEARLCRKKRRYAAQNAPASLCSRRGSVPTVRARGRYLWRKEARLCRGEVPLRGTDLNPHFLTSCRKENAPCTVAKEKTLRDELTGEAANSPKTGTGRHELPTELETPLPAALYLNLKSVRRRISGHGAQRGANRTSSASLSAAAPPSCPGRGFQRGGTLPSSPVPLGVGFQRRGPRPPALVPGRGFQRGGPQSRPFVPRGGMGDGWRPPCFGWGSKGEGPLRQRPLPLAP